MMGQNFLAQGRWFYSKLFDLILLRGCQVDNLLYMCFSRAIIAMRWATSAATGVMAVGRCAAARVAVTDAFAGPTMKVTAIRRRVTRAAVTVGAGRCDVCV